MKLITKDGIKFQLNANGTAVIMAYTGASTRIVIPETFQGFRVTGIEAGAFMDCYSLSYVSIPASITHIGQNAFKNCGRKETVDRDLGRAYTATSRRDLEYMFGYGYECYESRMMGGEDPVKITYDFTVAVTCGSYAERYCKENNIPCIVQ